MQRIFGVGAAGVLSMTLAAHAVGFAFARTEAPVVTHVTVPLGLPSSSFGTGVTFGVEGDRIFVGANAGSTCRLAVLSAATLRLLTDAAISCDDPRLDGEPVMPVEATSPRSQTGTVRIAVRTGATGVVSLGPVVMHYPNISDGRPEWVYGGGSLWLYDVGTPSAPGTAAIPATALRISTRTGTVLQRVAMPVLSRVVLAADDDGLWFGPSSETGWLPHRAPALVYFVPLGASHPTVLRQAPTAGAHLDWIVASGHTTWVSWEADGGSGPSTLATYDSPGGPPRLARVPASNSAPVDIGEGTYDSAPVLDLQSVGLVAAEPGWLQTIGTAGTANETVVAFDAATGEQRTFARIAVRPAGILEGNAVAGDTLYLLVGTSGSSVSVYRVAPSGR